MLGAAHDLELAQHPASQRIAGQHALHGKLERPLRRPREQLLERFGLHVPDVAGVVIVHLVLHLPAGHADLLRVDHDDVITGIHVRRIDGLVLAAEPPSDLRGEPPERLAVGVDDVPVAADALRLGRKCLHVRNLALKMAAGDPTKDAEWYWAGRAGASAPARPVRTSTRARSA